MRWKTTIAIALMAAAASGAAAGGAAAEPTCTPDSLQSTCQVLDTCAVIGALNITQPPNDAVDFYRSCLFTDHSFHLATVTAGTVARHRAQPLPRIYASTFWPLYCMALRRAGRSDPSICDRRVRGSASRPHHRKRHHRSPSFTG